MSLFRKVSVFLLLYLVWSEIGGDNVEVKTPPLSERTDSITFIKTGQIQMHVSGSESDAIGVTLVRGDCRPNVWPIRSRCETYICNLAHAR